MDPAQNALHQSLDRAESQSDGHCRRRWPPGCLVSVRGRRWRLLESRAFADCHLLMLRAAGRADTRRVDLLCPFDQPQLIDQEGRLRRASWPVWLRTFRALARGTTPHGRLRTASAARIDLHAYQLEPSLAVLDAAARRLLLADEVGLGKTIQAGLIVSELHARQPAARTLILTPAGLRDQWAREMRERFAIDAAVVDAVAVRRAIAGVAAGTNPWAIWRVIVASVDFVKRPDVLRALDPFTWDTLVVDEAHQCALAPERSAAVRLLAARSRHVVLLTATPHAGDDESFERLCDIGRTGRDDRVVMFRRNRSDVGIPRTRRVHLLRVRCSERELRMHRLLERYAKAVWTSAAATSDARLAMIVLRKRALSSPAALARSLERRLQALFDVPLPEAQLPLPFAGIQDAGEDTPEDDEPTGCLAAPGLEGGREREWLGRVLDAARNATTGESKLRALTRLLHRVRESAIVFTEYRDTAVWLASALADTGGTARPDPGREHDPGLRPDPVVLHGGLSRSERQDVERRFRTGQAHLLVATDAAGQGLNLHHRCRLVVNLELPWNPVRLEQRIGRVDRLGQTRRPHAVHLVARATAEERIVRRLVVRQERARQRVGDVNDAIGAATEDQVTAAVMEHHRSEERSEPAGQDAEATRRVGRSSGGETAFTTIDLRALAQEELARLSWNRLLRTGSPAPALRLPVAACSACIALMPKRRSRKSALSPGVLCVFVVRGVNHEEEVVDESLVPLHLKVASTVPLTIAAAREVANGLLLERRVLAVAAPHRQATSDSYRRVIVAALEHERALEAAEARPVPLQPGMFDRRAIVQAEHAAAGRAARDMVRIERRSMLEACASRPLSWRADLALVLVIA